jgi:hypothetical protein
MRVGNSSPWGEVQEVIREGELEFVVTAGHGGYVLAKEQNAKVPSYMRRRGGFYEEDCEWCFVAAAFPEQFGSVQADIAKKTMASYYPDEYERFYGEELKPGESYAKDKRTFLEQHRHDWIVISAITIKGLPLVECVASVGGSWNEGVSRRTCVVRSEDYDNRNRFGFVLEPGNFLWID